MNKIYDKLLLLLAVFALIGGIAVFVLNSGSSGVEQVNAALQPSDNPYQSLPVPESSAKDVSWPEPAEQSSGWVYDVFTPPKIYIDENGRFSAEGWVPPPPPKPFGVYLVDIVRKLYRIQLEGYIEEDLSDASKGLLLLSDEELQTQVRVRPGEENADSEFKILNFEIVREIDPETGTVDKVVTATMLDLRSGEEVQLIHGQELYESGVTVVIGSDDASDDPIELSEVGMSFVTSAGSYVLKEINLEEKSVTVEKQATEEDESKIQTLYRQLNSVSPDAEEPGPSEGSAAELFDFAF